MVLEALVATYRQEAAWHWPTAPGQILSVSHSGRGGASVKYRYGLGGRFYESSSADLPHLNRSQLNVGNTIVVRFNPTNPKISVLDPGLPPGRVFELFCGPFFWVGSGIMAMLCVSSYRDPANNIWSFGWKHKQHSYNRL
jgi:hypothetical protein